MEAQPTPSSFITLLGKTIIPKVQIVAFIVIVVGVIFKILGYTGASELLMMSMSIMAVCYFLSAFIFVQLPPTAKPSLYSLVLYKVIYISGSVTIIGILFGTLKMEGADLQLLSGTLTLGIASIVSGLMILSNNDNLIVLKKPLIYGVPWLVIGIYFLTSLSII